MLSILSTEKSPLVLPLPPTMVEFKLLFVEIWLLIDEEDDKEFTGDGDVEDGVEVEEDDDFSLLVLLLLYGGLRLGIFPFEATAVPAAEMLIEPPEPSEDDDDSDWILNK